MVRHGFHATLTSCHQLCNGAEVLFGNVDGHTFHRLAANTFNVLRDNLRLTDGQFEAFATHLLDQDGKSQLPAPLNLPRIGTLGWQNLQGHVTHQLAVKTILDLTCGDLRALDTTSHRRSVDTDRHRDRRIINGDQRQRTRIFKVDQRFADHDVFNTSNSDDVAGASSLSRNALQAFSA